MRSGRPGGLESSDRGGQASKPEHEKSRLVDKTKRLSAVHGYPCGQPPRERNGPGTKSIARTAPDVKPQNADHTICVEPG